MTIDERLAALGFCAHFARHFEPHAERGLAAARVVREESRIYRLAAADGDYTASVSGSLWFHTETRAEFPAIGDWVAAALRPDEGTARIAAVLPRRTCFSRKCAGTVTSEQVLAANVDVLLLVSGLDRDFNVRRLERYAALARQSGADPVIVLNKADLCTDDELASRAAEVRDVVDDAPVLPVSALTGAGLDALALVLEGGRTGALVGSSGVGKSALLNGLSGADRQTVGALRESDGRGRHTTTHRQLFVLASGVALIDSPGLREVQLWADEAAVDATFADIDDLARQCRFRDCGHDGEPGCAVLAALETGALDGARFESYLRLQREARWLERRKDQKARLEEQAKWRRITRAMRKMKIRR